MLKLPAQSAASAAAAACVSRECITLLSISRTASTPTVSSGRKCYSKNAAFSNQYSKLPPHFLTKSLGRQRLTTLIKGGGGGGSQWTSAASDQHQATECPDRVDVAILGGGIVGASVAYFLKQNAPSGLTVALFERDLTYLSSATTLSLGGIRQQWQHPENILMSLFTANFLQNVKKNLTVPGAGAAELADVGFREQGYLLLADESQAEQMIANHKLQLELGAQVELLSVDRLRERFPHISTEGVLLASHGLRNEGWFEPLSLLQALRRKTVYLGGHYVHGEVVDFRLRRSGSSSGSSERRRGSADEGGRGEASVDRCNDLVVRLADGRQKTVRFGIGVICAGVDSVAVARKLGYGGQRAKKDSSEEEPTARDEFHDVRANDFPIEPRKRFAFVAELPTAVSGPTPTDFPFMLDTTGAYCRPETLGGTGAGAAGGQRYILGKTPTLEEEPDPSNLEVDYTYFEKVVQPTLARRLPALGTAKLRRAWAGYYDYNRLDHNPIIGQDPYYSNLIWAAGFSGRGLPMGPAVGRAITELILHDEYRTIDLSQYGWERFFEQQRRRETMALAKDNMII